MNNSELIQALGKRTGLKKDRVTTLLSSTVSIVTSCVADHQSVTLPLLGTFDVKTRKERLSVHPASGKRFLVPKKCVVGFKPISSLKGKVREDNDE